MLERRRGKWKDSGEEIVAEGEAENGRGKAMVEGWLEFEERRGR